MAVAYDSAGAGAGVASGTSLNVTLPATLNAGDDIFIHCMADGTANRTFTATGYTQIANGEQSTVHEGVILHKKAVGGEGGTAVTVTMSGTTSTATFLRAYRVTGGHATNGPHNRGNTSGTTSPLSTPAATLAATSSLLLAFISYGDDDIANLPALTGGNVTWTEQNQYSSALGGDGTLQIHSGVPSSTTQTAGSYTFSPTDPWVCILIEVEEAGAGGTPHEINPADSVTMSDAITVAVGRNVSVNDSVTPSDALVFDRQIVIPDTVNLADALALERQILLTDTIGLSDLATAERGINQAVDDSVGLADNATLESGKGVSVDDSVALADALRFDREIVIADSINLSDQLVFDRQIVLTDSVALADAIALQYGLTIQDVLDIADAIDPVLTPGGGNAHTVDIDDTVSLADALSFVREIRIADSVVIQDSNARQLNGLFLPDGTVAVETSRGVIIIGRF